MEYEINLTLRDTSRTQFDHLEYHFQKKIESSIVFRVKENIEIFPNWFETIVTYTHILFPFHKIRLRLTLIEGPEYSRWDDTKMNELIDKLYSYGWICILKEEFIDRRYIKTENPFPDKIIKTTSFPTENGEILLKSYD